jgi:hypothetical protein
LPRLRSRGSIRPPKSDAKWRARDRPVTLATDHPRQARWPPRRGSHPHQRSDPWYGATMRARLYGALGKLRASLPSKPPPIYLAACAVFRNEGSHLPEWVEFHRRQGIQRFWLYDNLSTDAWETGLAPWLSSGVVTVSSWPHHPGQLSAYSHCLRSHRADARWVAFIDIDEFLFSPTGRSLPSVLDGFEGNSAVVANWRLYGTSGHFQPPTGPTTQNYLWRVKDDAWVNQHVKSIVNPRKTSTWVQNPHFFRHYAAPVGEDRKPVSGPFRFPPTAELLRINHYYTRSVVEWRQKCSGARSATGETRDPLRAYIGDTIELDGTSVPRDEVFDDVALRAAARAIAPDVAAGERSDQAPHGRPDPRTAVPDP